MWHLESDGVTGLTPGFLSHVYLKRSEKRVKSVTAPGSRRCIERKVNWSSTQHSIFGCSTLLRDRVSNIMTQSLGAPDEVKRPTAQPTKRPARDESLADSASENEAEDDMPQKKHRRKPRNPANRLPRPPASLADLPVTHRPRATPRQKIEWPPTPATPPQQTEAPAADAAAEAAAPAQRSLQATED
ncbi:hypothetical protein J6590_083155 [Homalodisca vitripennis]|nr:hypothetical protein J6590_083155 [Homalodisca vitripennis]